MKCRNLDGTVIKITAPSTADATFAVAHELGKIPRGAIIVLNSTASAQLYHSIDPWDATNAYLKSSVAFAQYYVIFFC